MARDNFDDLQASYGRCLRERDFINRFYDVFLESHPAIAPMFEKTEFRTQRLALRRGISVAISYAAGSSLASRTFEQMADVHARNGRVPVAPDLYRYWIDSLLTVIGEVDPEMSPKLEQRWRMAMNKVTDAFVERY